MDLRRSLVVAVAAGAARAAHADPEPIRFSYAAPSDCPSEADVIARLAERAHVQRVEPGGAPSRMFAIEIAKDPAGYRGALSVDGSARDVTAATCDEVVGALVLVAALAVQERAPAPRAIAPPAPPPPAPVIAPRWRFAAGAGVARYSGMTPSARVGVPVYVDARRGASELRATFDATASDDGAIATFRWTAGRIEGCPYALTLGRVDLAPCAGVQVGALSGKGTAVDQAASDTRLWLAPEAVGRVRLHVGPAAAEVEAAAAAPLERDRYYFAPANTVHQVPSVVFEIGASVAIEFR
jgi:hypothetical protein